MSTILREIGFISQRFTTSSIPDILLVAAIIFVILKLLQRTRGYNLVRGVVIVMVIFAFLSLFKNLTAFNWIVSSMIPVLLIMIPIVFAPEIRRSFERVGGLRTVKDVFSMTPSDSNKMYEKAGIIADSCMRLALRNHGALIVMEYFDDLDSEITAGVLVDAEPSVELLLQIFYPNTPLHDGAVVIRNGRIYKASCVMPLSSRNALEKNPERHMGLRHRAALGVSEETDCLAIVVSEETGTISLCRHGAIERDLSPSKLEEIIKEAYERPTQLSFGESVKQIVRGWTFGFNNKDGNAK